MSLNSFGLVIVLTLLGSSLAEDTVICPNSNDPTFYPYPGDCSKYIQCIFGEKYIMTCYEGFYWNQVTHKCDGTCNTPDPSPTPAPTTASTPSPTTPTTPSTTATTPTTSSPAPTPTPTTATTPGSKDPDCPATGLYYLPFYSDCTLFYQCNEGVKTLMQCPSGYAWSIVINACREIELVDCSYTTLFPPTATPPNNGSGICPDNGLTYLPHYGDCTKYIQCFMGTETTLTCDEGLAWSIVLAACDLIQFVDCSYTTLQPTTPSTTPSPEFQCPSPSTEVSLHPHPYDCSKFIECVAGVKYILECPMGYFFSNVLQRCELQTYVDCSYTSYSPTYSTPTPTTPTATTSHPTAEPGNRCNNLANGTFLPHPTDCAKFIECSNGKEEEFDCPGGTTWDQSILTCDNNPDNCPS